MPSHQGVGRGRSPRVVVVPSPGWQTAYRRSGSAGSPSSPPSWRWPRPWPPSGGWTRSSRASSRRRPRWRRPIAARSSWWTASGASCGARWRQGTAGDPDPAGRRHRRRGRRRRPAVRIADAYADPRFNPEVDAGHRLPHPEHPRGPDVEHPRARWSASSRRSTGATAPSTTRTRSCSARSPARPPRASRTPSSTRRSSGSSRASCRPRCSPSSSAIPTTAGHSGRVAALTVALARAVERSPPAGPARHPLRRRGDLQQLRYAALLHDFGKVGVREHVLVKAEKLYPHELPAGPGPLRQRPARAARTRRLRARLAGREEATAAVAGPGPRAGRALGGGAGGQPAPVLPEGASGAAGRGWRRPRVAGRRGRGARCSHPRGAAPLCHPARLALRGGAARDREPRHPHLPLPLADPLDPRAAARARRSPTRHHEKLDGTGYPRGVSGRRHPGPVADDDHRRHLRRAHRQRPPLQEGAAGRSGRSTSSRRTPAADRSTAASSGSSSRPGSGAGRRARDRVEARRGPSTPATRAWWRASCWGKVLVHLDGGVRPGGAHRRDRGLPRARRPGLARPLRRRPPRAAIMFGPPGVGLRLRRSTARATA